MSDQDMGKDTADPKGENTPDPQDQNNNGTNGDAANDDQEGNDPKDQAFKDQQKRAEKAEAEAKAAKAEVDKLNQLLAEKADPQGEVSEADFEKLAEEHDVSVDFVKGLAGKLTASISKQTEKLVSDKLSEKDKEREKERILNDFKSDFDKVADEDAWEGTELNEQAVRSHYLAEKAKNPNHSVSDSVDAIYGSFKKGKATVEDDPQGADQAGESIDFTKLSKDPEKLSKVLKDPKARTAYYKWRDQEGI